MKKNLVGTIVTAAILSILVWVGSILFLFSYKEWSFFIGFTLTIVVFFFSSSGGITSQMANLSASRAYGKVQKDSGLKANVGFVFYGIVLFTVVSLVVQIITY
ncbi:hypothetical protein D3H55_04885 [Bacillus salacetis]|uniref:Uncharacterized protein n=1 Tax=Bacillus salacetis TaxID=2315464 RepID=A0A3A1R782_9BACI|nr:hypothetical protein [Bacillus salacetis]RIW37371.1 hypothetical protein D3H55_04885 [Bacillus salacetis]